MDKFKYSMKNALVRYGKRDRKAEFEYMLLKYQRHAMAEIMRSQYELAAQGNQISVEFLRAMSYGIWKDMRRGKAPNVFDQIAWQDAADAMIGLKKFPI